MFQRGGGRSSRRHRRHRHGAQHGRQPCRLCRSREVRRRRDRRLTIAEIAQIAGRAGRHQRDGTFGSLGLTEERGGFSDSKSKRSKSTVSGQWTGQIGAMHGSTSPMSAPSSCLRRADDRMLRPSPELIDLAVLKHIAEDPAIAARKGIQARRLWSVCGLPDSLCKVGPMHHSRMVRRLFSYIGEGGHIPHEWFAAEVTRLDNMTGDIEVLADRLAGIRSWAYIAHRADWLKEPARWSASPARSRDGSRMRSTSG